MDQGLKERLIGAAVLVGLGVWLIPWVLDGSGPEERAAPELELPAQESLPMRTHTIDLSEPRQTPAPTTAAVAPERAARTEPAASAPAQTARPQAASAETPESDAPAPAVAAASLQPAPEPAAPAAAEPAADAAAVSNKPAEPAAVVAKAEAEPQKPAADSGPASAAARPAASGEWMVQLGSFSEEENAKRLAERVRTFGYRPDISNVRTGGRSMYRVRVGPHATRGQAEAAASSLSAHGFVAQVVAAE
ncbi:MAG TPA: SPOR domain-containing protein [Gammaproteobacteria bacterium]